MTKVEINKDMKLSQHFTLGELTKTSYDMLDKNIPSRVAIENLKRICEGWLEDLRYFLVDTSDFSHFIIFSLFKIFLSPCPFVPCPRVFR